MPLWRVLREERGTVSDALECAEDLRLLPADSPWWFLRELSNCDQFANPVRSSIDPALMRMSLVPGVRRSAGDADLFAPPHGGRGRQSLRTAKGRTRTAVKKENTMRAIVENNRHVVLAGCGLSRRDHAQCWLRERGRSWRIVCS